MDRVQARPGRTVRLRTEDRKSARTVALLELSLSHVLVVGALPLEVGSAVAVTIALQDRHLEFELPAVIAWHGEGELALSFEHLTARQSYGLVLAIELERQAVRVAAARLERAAG